MNGLPDVIGKPWRDLLIDARPPVDGFEEQFSWLRRQGHYEHELLKIEDGIASHFESLVLPDHTTIYDYIVLGLRPKDVVATFNWDPFLPLAHKRNRAVAALPDIRFLHGCVGFATCPEHDILGSPSEICPQCRRRLVRSKLFFPDQDKDYTKDSTVNRDWRFVAERLKRAFHLTIFGYSGPATDYKAKALLLEGWSKTPFRDVSHVEIIDIKDGDELRKHWKQFIPFNHDMVCPDFWDSTIARWPRRTQDYKLSASLYGLPSEYLGPLRTESLHELQDWHAALAESEKQKSGG